MKTLVLSALISVAAIGNSMANTSAAFTSDKGKDTETVVNPNGINDLKKQMAFHKNNVDVLWSQYESATARIKQSRGNHAELEREKAYFTGVYQQDIDNGVRVEESKKAIAEIETLYVEKHAQRDAFEAEKIALLQAQLKAELRKEEKRFKSAKKKYAKLTNEQVQQWIDEVEQHLAQSIQRIEKLSDETKTSVAAI